MLAQRLGCHGRQAHNPPAARRLRLRPFPTARHLDQGVSYGQRPLIQIVPSERQRLATAEAGGEHERIQGGEAVARHVVFDYTAQMDVTLPPHTPTMPHDQCAHLRGIVEAAGYYNETWKLVQRKASRL